ncbi:hypothetical protein SARC_14945, partial [Sphaeroforma arctica JP610]
MQYTPEQKRPNSHPHVLKVNSDGHERQRQMLTTQINATRNSISDLAAEVQNLER